jgi:hypothetical protein
MPDRTGDFPDDVIEITDVCGSCCRRQREAFRRATAAEAQEAGVPKLKTLELLRQFEQEAEQVKRRLSGLRPADTRP